MHLAQSAMALMMDWLIFGVLILSRSAIFTRSWWKCPPFSCSLLANSTASSFVTHPLLTIACARVPPNQSFPSSIMYLAAQCLALFLSRSPVPFCIPSNASISKTSHYFLVLVAYLIILGAIQVNSRESPRTIQVYYMLLGHYLYK